MMSDNEALDILRAQGYAVGAPDVRTGRVRVWIPATDEAIDVAPGRELRELAVGKLSFEDLLERREDETVLSSD